MTGHYNLFGSRATFFLFSSIFWCFSHGMDVQPCGLTTSPKVSSCPAKVSRVSWWMSRYGGSCPKRQYAYANSDAIKRLDIGWKRMTRAKLATTIKYKNKAGKWCYKGSSGLRSTETIASNSFNIVGQKLYDMLFLLFVKPQVPKNALLRIYPEPFADAVVRLLHDLSENRTQFSSKVPVSSPTGPELLENMSFFQQSRNEDFAQANLAEVFEYIRGGTGLNLPPYWKSIVPSSLPKRANPWDDGANHH